MQHIVEVAFSSFQMWGHIDSNRSGIGLRTAVLVSYMMNYCIQTLISINSEQIINKLSSSRLIFCDLTFDLPDCYTFNKGRNRDISILRLV